MKTIINANEFILDLVKKTEWHNSLPPQLRPAGESFINWCCHKKMLKFEGILTGGRVTVSVCKICGYAKYERHNGKEKTVEENNVNNVFYCD